MKKKLKHISNKLKQNHWTISTIVFATLALVLAVILLTGSQSVMTISPEAAGQKVVAFAKNQGAKAELVSSTDEGSLYEIVLSINGQEVPVYVTKDGKTLVPQPISLEAEEPEETSSQSTPTPTNIPKSDKPTVEAFVMAYCPYGTQIEKGLLPVAELLKDKIDFEIKFVYYAMHPTSGEVEEQLNQYCIQEEQNDKYLDYLTCFLEAGDGEGCIESVGIDTDALATCTEATDKEFNVLENLNDESKWLSGRFPKFNIHKAENDKYEIKGSPSLVINGANAQAGRDSASLLNAICAAFEDAPEECDTALSSAQPSPGFGFKTTSASTTSAGCGA